MCSAFIQFFSIVITNLTITCEILTCFFLKKYIKSGNITEKKNKTLKDFYYFLKLNCGKNLKKKKKKKKEFNEEFIAMWKRASGMSSPLCIGTKMKKTKV